MPHTQVPFPALVGLDAAQQALILLAIEPRLRGVVLAAPAGTGKSSLARGIREVLGADDGAFVELPPSVDAENLLGGLDLEETLRTGRVMMRRGVLARADGGIVYVDGINLLTDATANVLLSVLDNGTVNIEREGISRQMDARIRLLGSYDPAEGQPRQHLLDRVGLMVRLPEKATSQQRQTVLKHNLRGRDDDWQDDIVFVREMIVAARQLLADVVITESQIEQLSAIAWHYGVEGHRADVFAVRAACAAAAADLRQHVSDDDITLAARLVILPRATRVPEQPPEQQAPPQPEPAPPENDATPDDNPPPPEPPQAPPSADEMPPPPESSDADADDNDDADEDDSDALSEGMPPPEQILEALVSELPAEMDELAYSHVRRGRSGSRGSTDGTRGRHIRSVAGNPNRDRLDVIATLRAAAPWQRLRKQAATRDRAGSVYLAPSDIRVKRFRSKAGALFCFAVDASGSMALHRMRQAKGALHTLLEKAYVKRDRVALIAFRGDEAEVLLPPTQSVELARRALDLLPTGGGTPLASALIAGVDVAQQAQQRGIMQTVLVLLTDGRGNVPLHADAKPQEELQQLGAYVRESPLHVIVIDTKRSYLSRGEAKQLAEWLGGDYAYLPNASGEDIGEFVAGQRD